MGEGRGPSFRRSTQKCVEKSRRCLNRKKKKVCKNNIPKTFTKEIGRHRGMIANVHIRIGSNSYEKVKTFKYLVSLVTNQNSIQEEIKCGLKAGNSFYYSFVFFSSL